MIIITSLFLLILIKIVNHAHASSGIGIQELTLYLGAVLE